MVYFKLLIVSILLMSIFTIVYDPDKYFLPGIFVIAVMTAVIANF